MYYIRIDNLGKIEEAIIDFDDTTVLETETYRLIPVEEVLFNTVKRADYYYYNNRFEKIPDSPDSFHQFNYETRVWEPIENYLTAIRDQCNSEIKELANFKILEKYPIYRQLNYIRDINNALAIEMGIWIDAIRTRSNIDNEIINTTSNVIEIYNVVSNFKNYLETI